MNLNVHENLVYEFYNTLELPRNKKINVTGYIMKFLLQNLHWEINLEKLAKWFVCDCKGLLETPPNYNS